MNRKGNRKNRTENGAEQQYGERIAKRSLHKTERMGGRTGDRIYRRGHGRLGEME